jgi:tryptophanyl-tRNA synthetase
MRVLSGIQPSGSLHLGNYFGMIQRAIAWQYKAEVLYFIADYHALTSLQDPTALRRNVREVARAFLACGLDPERAVLFRQSDVPLVLELAWLLSICTPVGLLERCHSYKDKVAKGLPASHALFSYPVLMAADILLYQADLVPVGKDQKQHLEIARDVALKFNQRFGAIFRLPEAEIEPDVAVVPGIDGQKMSKSYGNTIELFGDPEEIRARVMAIKTDSSPVHAPKPVEGSVLAALYKLVSSPQEYEEWVASMRRGGIGYATYKQELASKILKYFAPMRERYRELGEKPGYVEDVLAQGAERASKLALPTLKAARKAVGLE